MNMNIVTMKKAIESVLREDFPEGLTWDTARQMGLVYKPQDKELSDYSKNIIERAKERL